MFLYTAGKLKLEDSEGKTVILPPRDLWLLCYLSIKKEEDRDNTEISQMFFKGKDHGTKNSLQLKIPRLRKKIDGIYIGSWDENRYGTNIRSDVNDFRNALLEGNLEQAETDHKENFLQEQRGKWTD